MNEINRIVLVSDICFSTVILEDLHKTDNRQIWEDFLITLRRHKPLNGEVYKFTGDGWIILFDPSADIMRFLKEFCITFDSLFKKMILPCLEVPPRFIGMTFGMDRGNVDCITIDRTEYIGRPINVACRLQTACKLLDHRPYNLIMSNHLYNFLKLEKAEDVEVVLKNISGDMPVKCKKILLEV